MSDTPSFAAPAHSTAEEPATSGSRAPRPPLAKRMISPPPRPRRVGKRPNLNYDPATDPDLDLPILFTVRCEDKNSTS